MSSLEETKTQVSCCAIPTPNTSHVGIDRLFPRVYEPSEDTFLFLDALQKDAPFLLQLKPTFVLEMGSGSGCVISFLQTLFHRHAQHDSSLLHTISEVRKKARENAATSLPLAEDLAGIANAATDAGAFASSTTQIASPFVASFSSTDAAPASKEYAKAAARNGEDGTATAAPARAAAALPPQQFAEEALQKRYRSQQMVIPCFFAIDINPEAAAATLQTSMRACSCEGSNEHGGSRNDFDYSTRKDGICFSTLHSRNRAADVLIGDLFRCFRRNTRLRRHVTKLSSEVENVAVCVNSSTQTCGSSICCCSSSCDCFDSNNNHMKDLFTCESNRICSNSSSRDNKSFDNSSDTGSRSFDERISVNSNKRSISDQEKDIYDICCSSSNNHDTANSKTFNVVATNHEEKDEGCDSMCSETATVLCQSVKGDDFYLQQRVVPGGNAEHDGVAFADGLRISNPLFDVILFNPPYVPGSPRERPKDVADWAWWGGKNGREVINKFLEEIVVFIPQYGALYMVLEKRNRIDDVVEHMAARGFEATLILRRKVLGGEDLSVWRFIRK